VLLERTTGTVAPRFHAQKDHAPTVGEHRPWLPGCLAGLVELEVPKAAPVGVHKARLALRSEKEPSPPRAYIIARHRPVAAGGCCEDRQQTRTGEEFAAAPGGPIGGAILLSVFVHEKVLQSPEMRLKPLPSMRATSESLGV